MTSKDTGRALATLLRELDTSLATTSDDCGLTDDEAALASKVLSSACVWYYRAARGRDAEKFAQVLSLTTSEACVAAAALLRSQSLSPFEFGIWFIASGTREPGYDC